VHQGPVAASLTATAERASRAVARHPALLLLPALLPAAISALLGMDENFAAAAAGWCWGGVGRAPK
jgi:hypothetical protein